MHAPNQGISEMKRAPGDPKFAQLTGDPRFAQLTGDPKFAQLTGDPLPVRSAGDPESGRPALVPRSGWTFQLIMSSLIAALGSFNFGYNISVINSPALIFQNCPAGASRWSCFPVDEYTWGLVVSVMGIGALIGSLSTGQLANKYGRRMVLLLLNLLYISGALVSALALAPWMLLLGRLLAGLGVGASCIAVPMFLSEIASAANRGQITSVHQLATSIGLVFAELVALGGLAKPGLWRAMFGLFAVPSVAQLAGMWLYVPESPRYLAQRGDVDGAEEALQFLRQEGYDPAELADMVSESEKQDSAHTESWGLLRLLQNWSVAGRSLTVAMLLHVAQQFSGINVVFYFSSPLFAGPADKGAAGPSTIPAAISILNLVMTIVSLWLVERLGRRPLVLLSAAGIVATGATFIGAYLVGLRVLAILSILLFVAFFAVGMGPIPWLMMNELFPTQAIATAVSVAVATNWTCNFAVALSFRWLSSTLGKWLFTPYVLFTAAFTVYAWFQIPETKGRPLGFL